MLGLWDTPPGYTFQRQEKSMTDAKRERVYMTELGERSWAWVIRRRGSETLVEFPATGRIGWYETAELTSILH